MIKFAPKISREVTKFAPKMSREATKFAPKMSREKMCETLFMTKDDLKVNILKQIKHTGNFFLMF